MIGALSKRRLPLPPSDLSVAAGITACTLLIFVPLPPLALDVLVATSLASGFFMLAIVVAAPGLDRLLSFPALLLTCTILRLAVSVATSRGILAQGKAGDIVHAVGTFAIGGNLAAGLVVFAIIAIVQFIVVTKGAERIAEVCARFALDAMPGRQMSIEADLKAGDIDKETAQRRRAALSAENRLLGAMDGALKFVKGDSIASMILIAVNLCGGLAIGLGRGMSLGEAAAHYTILSVGDGLVAQVPSILSATAAGLLVTNPGQDGRRGMGAQLVSDIARARPAGLLVAAAIFGLGLMPGFPHGVLLLLAGAIALPIGFHAWQKSAGTQAAAQAAAAERTAAPAPDRLPRAQGESSVVCSLSPADLAALDEADAWSAVKRHLHPVSGRIALPLPQLTFEPDNHLSDGVAALSLDGSVVASFPTRDGQQPDPEIFALGLTRAVWDWSHSAIGVDQIAGYLESARGRMPELVALASRHHASAILPVVKALLRDRIPLRHARPVLEELAGQADLDKAGVAEVAERIRDRLRQPYADALRERFPRLLACTLGEQALAVLRSLTHMQVDAAAANARRQAARSLMDQIRAVTADVPNDTRVVIAVPAPLRRVLDGMAQDGGVPAIAVSIDELALLASSEQPLTIEAMCGD
jgi:type III secretion protein V